jgi:hypothetical protein
LFSDENSWSSAYEKAVVVAVVCVCVCVCQHVWQRREETKELGCTVSSFVWATLNSRLALLRPAGRQTRSS